MRIGNIQFKSNLFLAPMAGVTDAAFRAICSEHGYGLAYTEMISAKALMYKDKKTIGLLAKADEEPEPAIQIFGSDCESIKYAADYLSSTNTPLIDINMGCPAPKIVRNGEGSALMKDIEAAEGVIRATVENTDKPVTVKIRSGWNKDNINAIEFALMAQNCGVKAVAVHPRTRDMYYSGKADWSVVKAVKDNLEIPVIGGGDIFCAEDAFKMMETTGCDAVMVARGAMGNPWIFDNYNNLVSGKPITFIDIEERIATIRRHLELMIKYKGEHVAILEMRKHAAWYMKGVQGSSEFKRQVNICKSMEQLGELLERFLLFNKKQ
ncbi:MAG: tRNA dihydrouridine synthase DusB [Clostridia bacterium]|nr:tRNA dihydrouridine synthase DusB [Clostridia bacterium]